jgi:hypothetical protein
MFMGALWNKRTTRTIGRNAQKFFTNRAAIQIPSTQLTPR